MFFVVVSIGVVALVLFMAFAGPDRGKPPPASADSPQYTTPADEMAPSLATSTADPVSQPGSSGENWRVWGWILAAGGAIGLGFALFMPIAVETYVPSVLGGGGRSDVVNIGLIFQKGVAIAGSLSAIALGVFCLAVGAIIAAMGERR